MPDHSIADLLIGGFALGLITIKAPNWPFHVLLAFFNTLIWIGRWATHAREGALVGYNIYRLRRQGINGISMSVAGPVKVKYSPEMAQASSLN